MKSNLAIVSVILAFAVSAFAAPAPSGVKHHALPSDTAGHCFLPSATSPQPCAVAPRIISRVPSPLAAYRMPAARGRFCRRYNFQQCNR
jgi:hypothetical protein